MTFVSLLDFAGLSLMLALIPGPGTGAIVWSALVSFGLAAVLEHSAEVSQWITIDGGL